MNNQTAQIIAKNKLRIKILFKTLLINLRLVNIMHVYHPNKFIIILKIVACKNSFKKIARLCLIKSKMNKIKKLDNN